MLVFQLRSQIPADRAEAFLKHQGRPEDLPCVVSGAARVYKPNGELLFALLPGAISEAAKTAAAPFIARAAKVESKNRGRYAGKKRVYIRADGERSRSDQTPPVRTSVHGFFDRSDRLPFCRKTSLVSSYPEAWLDVLPLAQEVSRLFEAHAMQRFHAQLARAKETHPAYVISGTPFTTLTVNGTVSGAYHRDRGDYKPGFGCMTVFRSGKYRGCLLGFPAFGVAVDLHDRDLILFDTHEIHGNTPFIAKGEPHADFERVSIVYYYRSNMALCKSPEEELKHANKRAADRALGEKKIRYRWD